MDNIQVTGLVKGNNACGEEAGFKFSQIIRRGFGNPFRDYRDPCGLGSLMARYQTELLFDNRQILLFMNGVEPSSRLHRRLFVFSLCPCPRVIVSSSHARDTRRTRHRLYRFICQPDRCCRSTKPTVYRIHGQNFLNKWQRPLKLRPLISPADSDWQPLVMLLMFNLTDVQLKSMKWTPWGLRAAEDGIRHLIVRRGTMFPDRLEHLAHRNANGEMLRVTLVGLFQRYTIEGIDDALLCRKSRLQSAASVLIGLATFTTDDHSSSL